MTYAEMVHIVACQHAVTGLSHETVDDILWNNTAFPCSGFRHTLKQVHEYFTLGPVCQDCLGRGRQ